MPWYKTLTDIGGPEPVEWYSYGRDEEHAKAKLLGDSIYTMCIFTRVPEQIMDKQTNENPFPFVLEVTKVEKPPSNANLLPAWISLLA